MGMHNVGFYDKNNDSKYVTLFKDVNSSDCKPELEQDINKVLCEKVGTCLNEVGYNALCQTLAKHNIPPEKRKELRNLFGSNLRYGILD